MSSDKEWMGHMADLQRLRRRQLTTLDVNVRNEVVERRAPTDESVRLLSEMERAAEDRLVAAIRLHSTEFSCSAAVFRDPANPFETRMRVRFALGESKYDFNVHIPESLGTSKEQFVITLRDAVAHQIANRILQGAVKDLIQIHHFQ